MSAILYERRSVRQNGGAIPKNKIWFLFHSFNRVRSVPWVTRRVIDSCTFFFISVDLAFFEILGESLKKNVFWCKNQIIFKFFIKPCKLIKLFKFISGSIETEIFKNIQQKLHQNRTKCKLNFFLLLSKAHN